MYKRVYNFRTIQIGSGEYKRGITIRTCIATVFLFTVLFPVILSAQSTLRDLAEAKNFYIGAAVGSAFWDNNSEYREVLAREHNILVAENEMKFQRLEPSRDNFNWSRADELIDFAEDNNMKVRGHTLVWHNQSGWAENVTADREEMIEIMRNHISRVVGRYKGRVWHWDVVNEAIADGGGVNLRNSFWREKIGDDYIDLAFQFAHEADPDALLFYNDYGGEGMGGKSDRIYNLVQGMQQRGIPIHGVGLQCHLHNTGFPAGGIDDNMKRLNELGLLISITELDFRISMPADDTELEQQKANYKELTQVCLQNPNCTSSLTWGFTDRYSWIPRFFDGFGAALPFDEDYQPKPAWHGIWEALDEHVVSIISPIPGHQVIKGVADFPGMLIITPDGNRYDYRGRNINNKF